MSEKENRPKATGKLLGGLGAVATAIGLYAWNNVGAPVVQEVGNKLTPVLKEAVGQYLQENPLFKGSDGGLAQKLGEELLATNGSAESVESELKAFNEATSQCRDEVAQKPEIHLDDDIMVYNATVHCLLLSNQGSMLERLAQNDPNLKATVQEIRSKMGH